MIIVLTHTGVSWNKRQGKWGAGIKYKGKKVHLGSFASEGDAARAFDTAAGELYQKPILNFLPDGLLNPGRNKCLGSASHSILK